MSSSTTNSTYTNLIKSKLELSRLAHDKTIVHRECIVLQNCRQMLTLKRRRPLQKHRKSLYSNVAARKCTSHALLKSIICKSKDERVFFFFPNSSSVDLMILTFLGLHLLYQLLESHQRLLDLAAQKRHILVDIQNIAFLENCHRFCPEVHRTLYQPSILA